MIDGFKEVHPNAKPRLYGTFFYPFFVNIFNTTMEYVGTYIIDMIQSTK